MAQAYDFALDKIGMEIMSYQIWVDYINFLKGVEAVGSYAENQRITAVRRVYQRGCVNPMINIEQLWRDYNKYEEGINIHLAKKMIEDRSRDYMNARRVAKEYETVMKGLDRNAPSVPPPEHPAGGSAGGHVEEVHPVGEEQSSAYRGSDSHHKKSYVCL